MSAVSGQGVWQAARPRALSGKARKKFITTGGGKKTLFTFTAQPVPWRGTALIYEQRRAAEAGGVGHVRTTGLTFPFLLKYCLVLHLDCFLSETKE